jgi:hypothetical protein
VSSLSVVERLDVLEDGGAEVASARPWLAVHELLLDRREEALGDSVDAPIVVKSAKGRVLVRGARA